MTEPLSEVLSIDAAAAKSSREAELLAVLKASVEYRAVVLVWAGLPLAERERVASVVSMVAGVAALELARRGLWPRAGLDDLVDRLSGREG